MPTKSSHPTPVPISSSRARLWLWLVPIITMAAIIFGAAAMLSLSTVRESLLSSVLESQLGPSDQYDVQGLTSPSLSTYSIATLRIGPEARPDAVVQGLQIEIKPLALLRGRLSITKISAASVSVNLRNGSTKPKAQDKEEEATSVADILAALQRLDIATLNIPAVSLETSQRRYDLNVNGSLTTINDQRALNLAVSEAGGGRIEIRSFVEKKDLVVVANGTVADVSIQGSIAYGLRTSALSGKASTTLPGTFLSSDTVQLGPLEIALTISGTTDAPVVDARANLGRTTIDNRVIDGANGTLQATLKGLTVNEAVISSSGTVLGWQQAIPELGALASETATWTATARTSSVGELVLESLNFEAGDVSVVASGTLDTAMRANGKGTLSARGIGRLFGLENDASQFNVQASTDTTSPAANIEFKLDEAAAFSELSPFIGNTVRGTGRLGFADNVISVDALSVESLGNTITGSGKVLLTPPQNDVQNAQLNLTASWQDPEPRTAQLVANLTGPLASANLTTQLSTPEIKIGSSALENVALDINAKRTETAIVGSWAMTANWTKAPLTTKGTFDWREGQSFNATLTELTGNGFAADGALRATLPIGDIEGRVNANVEQLGPFSSALGFEMMGQAKGDIRFQKDGAKQSITTAFAVRDLAVGPLSATAGQLNATVDLARAQPSVAANFNLGRGDLVGQPFESFVLTATGPVDQLAFSAIAKTGEEKNALLDLGGRLERTNDTTRISVDKLNLESASNTLSLTAPTTVDINGGAIALSLSTFSINGGTAQITASQSATAVTAQIDIAKVGVDLLSDSTHPGLDTAIDATIEVSGPPTDLKVDGTLAATGTGEAQRKLDMVFQSFERRLSINATVTESTDGRISLAASLPGTIDATRLKISLLQDEAISGRIDGKINFASIARWLPLGDVDVTGVLTADMSVSGTMAAPLFNGRIDVAGGSYDDANIGLALRQIKASATVGNNGDVALTFAGQDNGKGTITGTGQLDLADDYSAVNVIVDAQLSALRAIDREAVSSRLSGTLKYEGDLASGKITGDLRSIGTDVFLAATTEPEIPLLRTITPRYPATPRQSNRGVLRSTSLDIKFDGNRSIRVTGQGMDSSWDGNATVIGTLARPRVAGVFTLLTGNASFLSQSFDLTSARVELINDGSLDPVLDITAERTRDGITAILKITGRASAPAINISSEPPYPSEEVLSRILFGKDMRQLGALEAAQIAAATTNIFGSGPGLMSIMRRSLDLDYIGIGGASGEALEVRKNFGRRLSFTIEQEVNGRDRLFSVEWYLTKQLAIRSTSDGQAGADIGLTWSKDY